MRPNLIHELTQEKVRDEIEDFWIAQDAKGTAAGVVKLQMKDPELRLKRLADSEPIDVDPETSKRFFTDFLIYAMAVRHDLAIFTDDRDFGEYKKILPIRLYPIDQTG